MSIFLGDSTVYGHLWATDEARGILEEEARFASWLEILACLAEAQAELGLVPAGAARSIREAAGGLELDLEKVAEQTRATSHSTLGLIGELRRRLPEPAREWVYYGATVQDLSDTWTALVMRRVGDLLDRDLLRIRRAAARLAREHSETPMLGRTHAQPGLPIPFGFKAAVWADELDRHRERLEQGRSRWEVAQLGGALGTMEFWGEEAVPLLEAFARRLGLGVPNIAWFTSRDRPAEFVALLAACAATIAKIGNEIMELQRLEIGEVREPFIPGTVGSITMPQKRNPEFSEHLDTLARLVRSAAGVLTETMVGDHERDGRTWKTEWALVPELGHYLLAQLQMARTLAEGLEVNAEAMAANLGEGGPASEFGSQELLRRLSARLGKHRAQDRLQRAYQQARLTGRPLAEALAGAAEPEDLAGLDRPALGSAGAMVDAVVEAAARRRAEETDQWA